MLDKIISVAMAAIVVLFSVAALFLLELISNPHLFSGDLFTPEMTFYIFSYFVMAISLTVILKKRGYEHYWAGMIPIAQTVAIISYTGRPLVNFFFLVIPVFNTFYLIYLLAAFVARIGKHPLTVFLMLIPGISHIFWVYLAITTEEVEFTSF